MKDAVPQDFVPSKTSLGAHLVATRGSGLPAASRRLLILADGRRTVFTLCQMLPDQNVPATLSLLLSQGLVRDVLQPEPVEAQAGVPEDLPEGWESASDYMSVRAREALGVAAVDVIDALEHVTDAESARQAMSQWYKALRGLRDGREMADSARLEATALLQGQHHS